MTTTAAEAVRVQKARGNDLDAVMAQIRRAEESLRLLKRELKAKCPYPAPDATPAVKAAWQAKREPIHAKIDKAREDLAELQSARLQIEARIASEALPLPTLGEIIERLVAVETVTSEDREVGYLALTELLDWLEDEESRAIGAAA